MVDALDSKSSSERSVGSSPTTRTMYTFEIQADHIPNIFGTKPLKDYEKVRYLSWFMGASEHAKLKEQYGPEPVRFEFKLASLERAADFLGLLYLRNQNTVLIRLPDDDRKTQILAKIASFSLDNFFLIGIRSDKPWGEHSYIGITKENALKLKLELG